MPKLKSYKALKKRIRITKNKKVLIKKGGRDHFNARESSKTTMNKRGRIILSKANFQTIKKLTPKI